MTVTVSDFFCGAGGSSTGMKHAGFDVKIAVNHWDRAIETHNTNHPEADHYLDDIQASHPSRYPKTDVLWMSPECFAAGTLILTKRGLVSIEDVRIGDEVLTHRGRWMPVTNTMSTIKDTIVVKGQGHYGLETTAEHPFYARQQTRLWNNSRRTYEREFEDPDWVKAGDLTASTFRWATPTKADELPIPPVPGRGFQFSRDFWWMVGRWLGDGSLRFRDKTAELTICCGKHEVEFLAEQLKRLAPQHDNRSQESELRWRVREIRPSYLFETAHTGLCTWLREHFGQHADGKTIPAWVLTMPVEWRASLLNGYISADGHRTQRRTRADSVSKHLALGIRLLAESLGYRASFGLYTHSGGQIEGREFLPYDMWMTAWENNASERTAFSEDGHSWSLVKSIEPGREAVTVYNLSVEDDESYVADGIVVHNCTNHSISKGRKKPNRTQDMFNPQVVDPAEERSRATMREVVEFTEYHKYQYVIVENVVDVRKWDLFDSWWADMLKLGYEGKIVYLNAQFFGVPQSRDRFYAVFWKKGNRAPNLDFRPLAWCFGCETRVHATQVFKKTPEWGRFGARRQYVYRCPRCAQDVMPLVPPAAAVINWGNLGTIIGDRKKPLKPKTMQRIMAGIQKFARPFTVSTNHSDMRNRPVDRPFDTVMPHARPSLVAPFVTETLFTHSNTDRNTSVEDPLRTLTARQSLGLLTPPFIMQYYSRNDAQSGTGNPLPVITGDPRHALVSPPAYVPPMLLSYMNQATDPRTVDDPLYTIATGHTSPVIFPPFFASMYGAKDSELPGHAIPVDGPLRTITQADHHALVSPDEQIMSFLSGFYSSGVSATGVNEALPTIMGVPHHALISFLASYYKTEQTSSITAPMNTVTGTDRHALVSVDLSERQLMDMAMSSRFRMLTPRELQLGMGFPSDYIITGNDREKVKQCGNAVVCPVAQWIGERVLEAYRVS